MLQPHNPRTALRTQAPGPSSRAPASLLVARLLSSNLVFQKLLPGGGYEVHVWGYRVH